MSIRAKWFNGGSFLQYFDNATQETVDPVAPCVFRDDFLGKDTLPAAWTAKDVSAAGLTTPIILADGANGVATMMLDATVEAQESGLYWNDQRPLILNQGLMMEFRAAIHTLPTLTAELVMGLAGDFNIDNDVVAESIWFKADGNGDIVLEYDDTVHTADDIASGVTVVADAYHIYRIDCTTITGVKFFIDGVQVGAVAGYDMSQVAGLKLQPYFHVNKAAAGASAGLGELYLDYVRIWQKRS